MDTFLPAGSSLELQGSSSLLTPRNSSLMGEAVLPLLGALITGKTFTSMDPLIISEEETTLSLPFVLGD